MDSQHHFNLFWMITLSVSYDIWIYSGVGIGHFGLCQSKNMTRKIFFEPFSYFTRRVVEPCIFF